MKGQLTLPIISIIITFLITVGILLPIKFLTTPIVNIVKYEENYDNAQMILISLLSSTKDGKAVQQIIGEHLILGEPKDLSFLNEKLDKLVSTKCYKLSTLSELLVKSPHCTPQKYTKEADITLPYNSKKLTEKLILVID